MLQVGLSTLFLYTNGIGFDSVPMEIADDTTRVRPAFWELVDEGEHRLNKARLRIIRQLVEIGYRFAIHAPFKEIDLSSVELGKRIYGLKRIKESVDAAAEIEALYVVVHPCGKEGGLKEAGMDVLLELFDYSSARGIRMGIENMPPLKGMRFTSPDDFIEFYRFSPKGPQLVLDVAHAFISGFLDQFLDKLTSKVLLVHCSDTNGAKDEHLKIGAGTLPWRSLIDKLISLGYTGNLSVESVIEPYDSVAKLREFVTDAISRHGKAMFRRKVNEAEL